MDAAITDTLVTSYWQATGVSIAVVVIALGAFSLVSMWAGRHIDAKFEKHTADIGVQLQVMQSQMELQHKELQAAVTIIERAVAQGAKEHEDWRVEMQAINEKVSGLIFQQAVQQEVDKRMQAFRDSSAG